MKYAFIDAQRGKGGGWPVAVFCRMLEVSRSGYYAWRKSAERPGAVRRRELLAAVRRVHLYSRATYGSPRLHQELLTLGHIVSLNTVARMMKVNGIKAKTKMRFRIKTTDSAHDQPIAPNGLNRSFTQSAADRAWVADITYVATGEGWLYLAVVLDLFSRRVVGWSMGATLHATLAIEALEMALLKRHPGKGLVVHTDRGVQYACRAYRDILARHGLVASMSRRGNCYDNAVMESFYKTLKTELVYHAKYQTRAAAKQALFEYIEVFYNRQRSHSALGYKSPESFEAGR